MMDAAEGAGVEPTAPSDHDWAHAGTDRRSPLGCIEFKLLRVKERRQAVETTSEE